MVQSQFSLSWDSYKNSICKGFSSLQHNGEFVDMTLAADGHYVKVHQVLMALASPYLKELISSAPCQHPVVFLNNISHRTLSLLLIYIYTGEVHIPADNLPAFAEAAKALHIKGLENITGDAGMTLKVTENMSQMEDGEFCHVSGIKRMAVPANDGTEQIGLPAAARKIIIKKENKIVSSTPMKQPSEPQVSRDSRLDNSILPDVPDMTDDHHMEPDSDDEYKPNDDNLQKLSSKKTAASDSTVDLKSTNLQFTVSIRGSLQVILNRYIYNLHSSTQKTGVKRWRCVEYRNHKCMAFVVTKGNVVLNRANLHNHSFHDKKILAKIEKKCVYTTLDDVTGYKEKDDSKMSDAEDDFMMLDDFGSGMPDISDKTDSKIN